ncbi:DUF3047 domain-containing protein [Uliginosibacterium sp. H3]|uniref:DUF3047 domain-containing protein n=1 Tax=Uliginosibacterium silvisoli TaxID=3114758 RepID=A0ABU6K477_9RHOO|nr:DUF3047 domain-containing protein [Uliginosibacterium sp. H3]
MTRVPFFLGTLILTCLSGQVSAQDACTPRSLGFGAGGASWEHRPLSKMKKDTRYGVVEEGGSSILHAEAEGSASFDATAFKPAIPAQPVLAWRWRTSGPIPGADNRDKSKEDSPLRVIVAFDGDIETLPAVEKRRFSRAKTFLGKDLPYAVLMYTWSDKVPTGSLIPSAHTSQVKMIAIAPDTVGAWQSVSRNVIEDYKRAWGKAPGKLLGVAVMTDTDNTGAKAAGDYADLRLACSP